MKIISTNKAPGAIGPYNQAIAVGNIVYTSGQIPLLPDGGESKLKAPVSDQTRQCMENLQAVLEEAGAKLSTVIKTTVFIADMDDFAEVNKVYGEFFFDHKPARSCVAVKTLPKNVKVEIEAIATIS